MLGLSSRQVQAAIDYIDQHRVEVQVEYEKIMERIRRGNPAAVQQRLQAAREKFQQRMANRQHEALDHAPFFNSVGAATGCTCRQKGISEQR